MSETIFITGASGHLGGAVIKHLLARGVAAERIVAGSRNPEKLQHLTESGVAVQRADFDDAQGLVSTFKGADTVLIISTDELTADGRRLRQHRNAIEAAVVAGVQRIAYTSLPNPTTSPLSFAPDHALTEQAIAETGLPSLVFRNGWYHENLLMGLPSALQSGHWYTASEGAKTAYAARDEMAEAIAAALANPPAGSKTYTLTGSEALSVDAIASLVRDATGRPLEVVNVTDEQLAQGLAAANVPQAIVKLLVSVEAAARSGSLATVTGDLEFLIGRPGKSLAAFIEESAALLS